MQQNTPPTARKGHRNPTIELLHPAAAAAKIEKLARTGDADAQFMIGVILGGFLLLLLALPMAGLWCLPPVHESEFVSTIASIGFVLWALVGVIITLNADFLVDFIAGPEVPLTREATIVLTLGVLNFLSGIAVLLVFS